MVRWEYKAITFTPTPEELNKLGLNGWEMIDVVGPSPFGLYVYYFKRKIED